MKMLYNILLVVILLICQCNAQCQSIEKIFKELDLEYLFNAKNSCCGIPSKYIKCESYTEKIIELNLSSLNIKKEILNEFKNLVYLQKLNIENNHFYGNIPHFETYLTNLKSLNIKNNDFDENINDHDSLVINQVDNISKRSEIKNQNNNTITIIIVISLIGVIIFLSLFYIYYRNFIKKDEGDNVMCTSCFNSSSNDVQQDEIMSERSFYAASVQSSMMEEEAENEKKKNTNALKRLSSKFFRYSNSHLMGFNDNKKKSDNDNKTLPNMMNDNRNDFVKNNSQHQDIVNISFSNSSNYMVDEDSSLTLDPEARHNGRYRASTGNDGSAEDHSYGRSFQSSNRKKKIHDDEDTMETLKLKEQLNRIKANLNSYPYGRVICDFEPKKQDEIELHFGDVVDIGCIYENGYAWVKNLRTNEEGMIQVNLLSTDLYNMNSRINEIMENLIKISKIKKQMSKPYIDYNNFYSSTASDLDNLKEKTAEEISSIVQRETSFSLSRNKTR
ncbi:hypothetical protein U3516DRAFT_516586, partial [Neocallimastix sp. 'constans']